MNRKCKGCRLYSRGLRKCLKGYVSPKSLKDTISFAKNVGPNFVCTYNEFKMEAMLIIFRCS